MHFQVTLKSKNEKTGPIPVTTTSADSCPPSCPFNDGGCYAKSGPLAMHWRKVSDGERGGDFDYLLNTVMSFPDGQLWRHNQAGDLMGEGDNLDIFALTALVVANSGKRGFTYTHKPLDSAQERQAVKFANDHGFTINLSGNNLAHADQLYDLDIGPVVVVLPAEQVTNTVTPKGRKVVVCPATIRDDVSCATCGLCARLRDAIVGFPAHGVSKKKAGAIAKG